MKLNNGIELDLQINSREEGTTSECISSLESINRGEYYKWDKEELSNYKNNLIELIEWRDNLLPVVADYINNFGLNFHKNTCFANRTLKDNKFHDYTELYVRCVQFGWEKNKVEVQLGNCG